MGQDLVSSCLYTNSCCLHQRSEGNNYMQSSLFVFLFVYFILFLVSVLLALDHVSASEDGLKLAYKDSSTVLPSDNYAHF